MKRMKEIVRQKADYVITLKENQGNLYKDVEELKIIWNFLMILLLV